MTNTLRTLLGVLGAAVLTGMPATDTMLQAVPKENDARRAAKPRPPHRRITKSGTGDGRHGRKWIGGAWRYFQP